MRYLIAAVAAVGLWQVGTRAGYALGFDQGKADTLAWLNVNAGLPLVSDRERENRERYGI